MKTIYLFLILIIYTLPSISQSKQEQKAKAFFWGENDRYKKAITIPDKWKNESAVIIYKNENYDFHKFGKNMTYKSSIRKRIKLLDKAAVKDFSEFAFKKQFKFKRGSFTGKQGRTIVGVKIIKPNGDEIEIDTNKDAVKIDGKTKIAIENLEVNDIIDFYIYTIEPIKSYDAFGFKPVQITLSEEYPIIDFKLFFETENDFFINFNSYNGAPDLKKIPTKKHSIRRYSLDASNINKYTSKRWLYPLVELPSYKFQVYFAKTKELEDDAHAFLPKKENIIKKKVLIDDIKNYYDFVFSHYRMTTRTTKPMRKYFKDKKFETDYEKVIARYYYMRHFYYNQFKEDSYAWKASRFYVKRESVISKTKRRFYEHFKDFLKRHSIPYEMVLVKQRYDGNMDDLLLSNNVSVLLKVKTEKPLYLDFYARHNTYNTLPYLIEGNTAYLLTRKRQKIDSVKKITLPISSYLQNEHKKNISLHIDPNFSNISISILNQFKGHIKIKEQNNRLIFSDYLYDDHKKYGSKPFFDLLKKSKKKKIDFKNKFNALKKTLKEKQKEKFEKHIKTDFNFEDIENYTYDIIKTGRYSFDSYFSYTESFTVKNELIKKAGPNYIIEIGKLLTSQIDLTEKERHRKENIYMTYPRSYNHVITFNIPEGYTISGVDKLNKFVDNSTGAFISNAKIEGNTLIINTSKQYKNNYEPNSNWSLMVDFLDTAFQFTNEKILLKKS